MHITTYSDIIPFVFSKQKLISRLTYQINTASNVNC